MSTDVLETTSISVSEITQRLAASRRVVPLFGVAGALLGVVLWLILPRTYTSEATLLPSAEDDSASLAGLAGLAGTLGIALPGGAVPESHLFPTIMKSTRIVHDVLETPVDPARTDGETLYDLIRDDSDDASVQLERAVDRVRQEVVRVGLDEETGIVRLSVLMNDPKVARRTADVFLEKLSGYLTHERTARARENREFVEGRRNEAADQLARAEERLRKFRELNRRITNSPDLLLEQQRLLREVAVQEEVFLELTRQYELARIEEQKATPVLEVLDPPTVKYAPTSPKLPLLVGVGLLVGLLLGSLGAVVFESPRHAVRGAFAGARALLTHR